jgi:2,3-dihydro-2,3-dihydroxybenzoate dehydrogenase
MAQLSDLLGPPRPAMVIGAAQGIGREVAMQLLRFGLADRLVLVDVDAELLQQTTDELSGTAPGVTIVPVVASMTDEDEIVRAATHLDRPGFGVVAAGIFEGGPTVGVARSSMAHVIEVNLLGALLAARAIADRLAAVGGGSLVALTSAASRKPNLEQGAYAASKAGLAQGMRVLGLEMAQHDVRVNLVAPGPTRTRMIRNSLDPKGLGQGDADRFRIRIPRGRIAEPSELASVIVAILSDAFQHVYLQEIVVDGGELLGM